MYKVNWNLSVQKCGLYVWCELHLIFQLCSITGTGGWWTHEDWQAWDPFYRVYAIELLIRKKKILASEISHTMVCFQKQWAISRTERWHPDQNLARSLAEIVKRIEAPWVHDALWSFVGDTGTDPSVVWGFPKPVRAERHHCYVSERPRPRSFMYSHRATTPQRHSQNCDIGTKQFIVQLPFGECSFKNLLIYSVAVLGLRCCVCFSLAEMCRLLVEAASLLGAQAPGAGASVLVIHVFTSCSPWALEHRLNSCGTWV